MRAAVVGAGISGLASAYRLLQAGWEVEVFESSDRAGGRVWTVAHDGYLADKGATTLSSHYHYCFQLAAELGLMMVPRAALGNAEIDAYIASPIARAMQIADTDCISRVELMSGLATWLNATFSCLAGGQGAMIAELARRVGGVRLGTTVTRVVETAGSVSVSCGETTEPFDAAVISCPVDVAARICPGQAAMLEPFTHGDAYTKTISVSIGTTRPPDCPAYLVQLPTPEDAEVAMIFLDSNKAPDRVPAGHGLLGVTWEKRSAQAWWERSDEEIVERTLQTVLKLFPGLRGAVDYTDVARMPISLPALDVGAFKRLARFHEQLDRRGRIQFAADFMSEPGQNTGIALAGRVAENLRPLLSASAGDAGSRAGARDALEL